MITAEQQLELLRDFQTRDIQDRITIARGDYSRIPPFLETLVVVREPSLAPDAYQPTDIGRLRESQRHLDMLRYAVTNMPEQIVQWSRNPHWLVSRVFAAHLHALVGQACFDGCEPTTCESVWSLMTELIMQDRLHVVRDRVVVREWINRAYKQ